MINNCLSTPHSKQMPQGIDKGLFTQHESGVSFDRQIKIRFLQQSASYLGADIAQHELAARYMQN
jgi:hypothetical protein